MSSSPHSKKTSFASTPDEAVEEIPGGVQLNLGEWSYQLSCEDAQVLAAAIWAVAEQAYSRRQVN